MMELPAVPSFASFMRIFSVVTFLLSAGANGDESPLTYTGYSKAYPLFPGEIAKVREFTTFPKGPIAISDFHVDIVEKDPLTDEMVAVPLSDAYKHHVTIFTSEEFYQQRNVKRAQYQILSVENWKKLPFPYRMAFTKPLLAQIHLINTRTMSQNETFRCLECPCQLLSPSGEEVKNRKFHCRGQLVEENNTACSPETYYGGLKCCQSGDFCLDDYYMSQDDISHSTDKSTQSVFYVRYTLKYTPVTPEIRPIYKASCCDSTGSNKEYDIPKCPDNDDVCVHELEYFEQLHKVHNSDSEEGEDIYVDVLQMRAHLHRGGISHTVYIESTGEMLCESLPTYGTGEPGEIGNEPGYLTSLSTCVFDPPRRMKTTEKLRIVTKYNATEAHTGVMSKTEIAIVDVPGQEGGGAASDVATLDEAIEDNGGPGQEGVGAASDVATLDEAIEDNGGPGQEGVGAASDVATLDETIEDDGGSRQEGGGAASDAATLVEDEGGFWNHLMVVAAVAAVIFATCHVVMKMGLVSGHQKSGSGYSVLTQSDAECHLNKKKEGRDESIHESCFE